MYVDSVVGESVTVLETAMVSYIFPSFKFVAVRSSKLELTRLVKLPV